MHPFIKLAFNFYSVGLGTVLDRPGNMKVDKMLSFLFGAWTLEQQVDSEPSIKDCDQSPKRRTK